VLVLFFSFSVAASLPAVSSPRDIGNSIAAAAQFPPGSTLLSDIAYGPDPLERYDVYMPAQLPILAPIVFMVHDGGWRNGDKTMDNVVLNKAQRWLPKGFVFISVNYPMLPDKDPLEQADAVARALAFAQQHAAEYQGDSTKVILMGHSAGAHLVSLISTDPALATSRGVAPWLGTVSLDSGGYDIVYLMEQPHLPLFDDAFGIAPDFWMAAAPYYALARPVPSILAVCSSQRAESPFQAFWFASRGKAIGTSVTVLPVDLTHEEINDTLGLPGAYTDAVERILGALDPVVAAILGLSAPVITSQPVSQDVVMGRPAEFAVACVGVPSLTHQWMNNSSAIAGATGSTYVITSTTQFDVGDYRVMVTGPTDTVGSNFAQLAFAVPTTSAIITMTIE
jgi:arylformamidase